MKVVDFGFARMLPEAPSTLTTPCYTLAYAAPEVLSSSPSDGYTEACDLWSLGVILVSGQGECVCMDLSNECACLQYTMLCGHAPFYGQSLSTEEIILRIREGRFSCEGPDWAEVSNAAKDVIEGTQLIQKHSHIPLGKRYNTSPHPIQDC